MLEAAVGDGILVLSIALACQGGFTLALMLYSWWRPERLEESASPSSYREPELRFTALLPARHEEDVIAETIARVWRVNYPKSLLEIVVICERSDTGTIAQAEQAIAQIGDPNVKLVIFGDTPINKPHGLNLGLRASSHEIVTVFDAEDDVHPDILQVLNTIMLRDRTPIVQAGVQLMDFDSSWYAVHNVLEYFFWFKSRLHFHTRVGMVPLGGNTVFIARRLLEEAGGWDENCLTEDADIGIRLSAIGERIAITYDAEHATREETPPSLASFIRQRTRWNQGFLQILGKGDWRRLPTLQQRLLAVYTLAQPFMQGAISVLWPISLGMILVVKVPVAVAIISFLPLYAVIFQFLLSGVGLVEFTQAYGLELTWWHLVVFTVGFVPYQLVLGVGAIRAVYRQLRGVTNWEKTEHTGAHREPVFEPAFSAQAAYAPLLAVSRTTHSDQVSDAA